MMGNSEGVSSGTLFIELNLLSIVVTLIYVTGPDC